MNTGAGSSYASTKLINALNKKHIRSQDKKNRNDADVIDNQNRDILKYQVAGWQIQHER